LALVGPLALEAADLARVEERQHSHLPPQQLVVEVAAMAVQCLARTADLAVAAQKALVDLTPEGRQLNRRLATEMLEEVRLLDLVAAAVEAVELEPPERMLLLAAAKAETGALILYPARP